ncbi:MurR/RpiR family transcriptional regulator [Mesorhizobium sp. Cs1299R1N1]|uniref:MurR/RpiR family transcriptional regulator n=1 Tax=Mesorhizobium sp. Cs1299R1N1 TaxID=3015172 RepID=UPI00301C0EEA
MSEDLAIPDSTQRRDRTAPDQGPLDRLEARIGDLPTALARAAVYIVENPEKVVRYSLKELSKFTKTGEASIVRLCHIAGFEGFSEFKLALAGQLAIRRTAGVQAAGDEQHPVIAMGHELARSIDHTVDGIDLSEIERVGRRLGKTVRIDVFGSGVSGIIAELFAYRLLRAGLNAHAIRDITLANEVANGLDARAAAIAISESGVTANTVEFLRSARSAGAYTVAVTCHSRSDLARTADAVLLMARLNIPAYGGYINAVPRAVYVAEALSAFASPSR